MTSPRQASSPTNSRTATGSQLARSMTERRVATSSRQLAISETTRGLSLSLRYLYTYVYMYVFTPPYFRHVTLSAALGVPGAYQGCTWDVHYRRGISTTGRCGAKLKPKSMEETKGVYLRPKDCMNQAFLSTWFPTIGWVEFLLGFFFSRSKGDSRFL